MAIEKTLLDEIKGEVVLPNNPDYKKAIARWATNAERKAKVVVFVKDADDIGKALQYAKQEGLSVAVRGGGHNAAGASSVEGGLIVDLSRHLNKVRIDANAKLGYVGGGSVWRTVDEEAMKHGLATVGGTVNHTGVGGLTLGGGYGWLTNRHGLAADNLRQATVVTADGSILTASSKENEDLFFAIRGGGGNFGVITEFVYQLHPQRSTVFAGPVIYAPDSLKKIIEITNRWWPNAGENEAMCQVATVDPEGRPIFVLLMFYNGSESEGRDAYKEFLDVGPIIDLAKEIPFEDLNAMQNAQSGPGRGAYLKGIKQKAPDFASTLKVLIQAGEISQNQNFFPSIIYEYFPLSKVNAVPIDATAFRRELSPNILLTFAWDGEEEKTQEARATAQKLVDILIEGQKGLSKTEQSGYTNYDTDAALLDVGYTAGNGDRAKLAFSSNYPKLQIIKKKYDPENVFNRWFPIIPAV
ncbi:FAD binding domain-containing protein [Ephemerocybe angulata]|uniref:FAD binding domain-containing protein n=1 Tax=Ephemerocybe angulata TaxID=980116 RepID=A0A8H6MF48_9AGAR|nr:FAD binding domain-containing protein [Tulosesus angulatus]